jgi:hypothetical protein
MGLKANYYKRKGTCKITIIHIYQVEHQHIGQLTLQKYQTYDSFVTKGISPGYTDIVPSFDLSSDHTPIKATISSSVTITHNTPILHNYKTNWEKYREEITNNINLKIVGNC